MLADLSVLKLFLGLSIVVPIPIRFGLEGPKSSCVVRVILGHDQLAFGTFQVGSRIADSGLGCLKIGGEQGFQGLLGIRQVRLGLGYSQLGLSQIELSVRILCLLQVLLGLGQG